MKKLNIAKRCWIRGALTGMSLLRRRTVSVRRSPVQLHNKIMTISWIEFEPKQNIFDGANVSATGTFERIFYVSTAGRVFARLAASGNIVPLAVEI